ncbi:MAG TPA: hypothetical protein VGJ33_01355 [Candidatus Angelobacter sp.]|jgi:hypothetical protein
MSYENRFTVCLGAAILFCALLAKQPLVAQSASPSLTAQEVNKLLEGRDIYYDQDGLIVHRANGKDDGGDTAQREGWYWLGVWIRQKKLHQPWTASRKLTFPQVIALLEPGKDGVFYRHPKLAPWNDPRSKEYGFSRDQMIPLVAAMGVWGMKAEITRLWDALPEDLLGKHAFNGNYRNFLGQDGQDCMAIKKRGCDATADCSLRVDNRDCSLQVDTRDCSLQVDTRSCGHDVVGVHINDPFCETAKATQNGLYATQKATCEAAKAGQNGAYIAAKNACEGAKGTQNALYASQKATCETGKTTQNALYASQKAACEAGKTGGKYACEAQKAADQVVCMVSNVHSGDLIGPSAVNLFRRAMNENPLEPISKALGLPPVNIGTGILGESELAINAGVRIAAAARDKDDTGDDLNLIVLMLMSKLRFPTPITDAAVSAYAHNRALSYGSYLGVYAQYYGNDGTDMRSRMDAGISGGWAPDPGVSGPFGAVRWYHRAAVGANPQLAEIYGVIIDTYIK